MYITYTVKITIRLGKVEETPPLYLCIVKKDINGYFDLENTKGIPTLAMIRIQMV